MSLRAFGEFDPELGYRVLDERVVRGSAGLILLVGVIAFINGFILNNYPLLPWLTGAMALNFALAVFINPRVAPTYAMARLLTWRQSRLPIGALQKKFAWSLGLALTGLAFAFSLLLVSNEAWFEPTCLLCLVCLLFLYLESAFGICVGCRIYALLLRLGVISQPAVRPNCMGDACRVD